MTEQTTTIPCQTCNQGQMTKRKVHRLSGPAVVIGYIFLIPSIIAISICILGAGCSVLFGAASAGSNMAATQTESLAKANVPPAIIQRIKNGESIGNAELQQLPQPQRQAIQSVQIGAAGAKAVGAGMGVAGLMIFVVLGIASFMSGLLGWILIMKKAVLQCNQCGAVVNAS